MKARHRRQDRHPPRERGAARFCPNLIAALRLVAADRRPKPHHFAALQRHGLLKVRGHGSKALAIVTDAGKLALAGAGRVA